MRNLIAVAVFSLALAATGWGATINVPGDYGTIQEAVDAANAGDVILVAPGNYADVTHDPGDGIMTAVIMRSDITLRGSGQTQTILDADSTGRFIHCEGVTGVTIRNLRIRRAFAEIFGAGILAKDQSSVDIVDVTFEDCGDGAIISLNSTTQIQTCTFNNNLAKQGGGISIELGSTTTITDCTFTGNSSPSGGGLFVRDSEATILRCDFTGNFITAPNGAGGGIAIINSTADIDKCELIGNTADGSGGGVAIIDNGHVTMTRSLIHDNETVADYGPGGGVYCDFSELYMDDVTVTRNRVAGSSSDGGGVYAFFADPMMIHQCTIAANECNGQPTLGGGISAYLCSPTIEKSIIAFNNPGLGLYCTDPSDDPQVSCSDIYGNQAGDEICGTDVEHNFSLDPLFCDLAGDNYRLQMSSPCYPGNHPDGGFWTCDLDRIGAEDPGCNPAGVDDGLPAAAATWNLTNRPNPFHPSTTIHFELANPGHVSLTIYDVAGR